MDDCVHASVHVGSCVHLCVYSCINQCQKKDQKLVGHFLKIRYLTDYYIFVPLKMYWRYGRSNRFWLAKCLSWSENGQWPTVVSSTDQ